MLQHGSIYFYPAELARNPSDGVMRVGQKVKIQLYQNMVMLHIK